MLEQANWTEDFPYCVYMHTSPSGKTYVGQTKNKKLIKRFGETGNRYTSSPVFYKAIQKYGWKNFKHEIIKDGLTKKEANVLEIKLIRKYKSINKSYNSTDGGEGSINRVCSDETKKKISKANKGKSHSFTDEQRERISLGLKGKKHSAERILKNSLSHKGQVSANKGMILINKDNISKYINKEELPIYVKDGWEKGASKKTHEKWNSRWDNMSEDKKENIREAQRKRIVTMEERIKKSKSHIKHGRYSKY